MWKVKNIYEADRTSSVLTWHHINVGSVWEEPDEEKKALFFKQKHTMDTFLSTGALTKEQYDFSLSGLVVKLGFDFDILGEEK